MKIYWRTRSDPELRDLPWRERRRISYLANRRLFFKRRFWPRYLLIMSPAVVANMLVFALARSWPYMAIGLSSILICGLATTQFTSSIFRECIREIVLDEREKTAPTEIVDFHL